MEKPTFSICNEFDVFVREKHMRTSLLVLEHLLFLWNIETPSPKWLRGRGHDQLVDQDIKARATRPAAGPRPEWWAIRRGDIGPSKIGFAGVESVPTPRGSILRAPRASPRPNTAKIQILRDFGGTPARALYIGCGGALKKGLH